MKLDASAVAWNTAEADRADRPLLVLLHGYSANEQQVFAFAPMVPTEYVVASVRAPLIESGGFAWFSLAAGIPTEPAPELADPAAEAVLAWLDTLEGFTSVALFGFSQGGAIGLHMLRLRPTVARFLVNIAGFTLGGERAGDAELASARPPVFFARGALDQVVPNAAFELTDEWLPGHSTLTRKVYPQLDHSVSDEELADALAFVTAHSG